MKTIEVKICLQDEKDREEFLKKVKAKGLSDKDIGQQLCKKLGGGNALALAAQYGAFRNGKRPLSKKLIPSVAEILGIPENLLHKLSNKRIGAQVLLHFDSKLPFKNFLGEIPEDVTTLDKFLVWLSTENERRMLMSRL